MADNINQRTLTTRVQRAAVPILSAAPNVYGANILVLGYAPSWRLLLTNNGPGNITSLRTRRRPLPGTPFAPWAAVASGLPIAPTGTITLTPEARDCAYDIDLEVTVSADGTMDADLSGV